MTGLRLGALMLPAGQVRLDGFELLQGRAQVFDELSGDDVGVWQVGGVLQALVLEPDAARGHLDEGAGAVIGQGRLQVANGLHLGGPQALRCQCGQVLEPGLERGGKVPTRVGLPFLEWQQEGLGFEPLRERLWTVEVEERGRRSSARKSLPPRV